MVSQYDGGMEQAPTGTVARAMQVLQAVAQAEDGVTVAGLAAALGLPRPTVHRQLGLLRDQGMVEFNAATHDYHAGPELVRLASIVVRQHGLKRLAAPIMRRIVDQCEETCLLGVYLPSRHMMTFAAQEASPHPLGYTVALDTDVSVVWGSSGRAILAFLPDDEVTAILAAEGPAPVTDRKPPSRATLKRELDEIRSRGYAYSEGDKIAYSRGISAPILGADGTAVGSLCLTIPAMRYDPSARERYARVLIAHAAELSRMLGATSGMPTRAPTSPASG